MFDFNTHPQQLLYPGIFLYIGVIILTISNQFRPAYWILLLTSVVLILFSQYNSSPNKQTQEEVNTSRSSHPYSRQKESKYSNFSLKNIIKKIENTQKELLYGTIINLKLISEKVIITSDSDTIPPIKGHIHENSSVQISINIPTKGIRYLFADLMGMQSYEFIKEGISINSVKWINKYLRNLTSTRVTITSNNEELTKTRLIHLDELSKLFPLIDLESIAEYSFEPEILINTDGIQIHIPDLSIMRTEELDNLLELIATSLSKYPLQNLNNNLYLLTNYTECGLCYEDIYDQRISRITPCCNQVYHVDHLLRWLHEYSTCPICKERLSPSVIRDIRLNDQNLKAKLH